MKAWMRLLNLLLALVLVLAAVPAVFAEEKQEEDAPDEFVILLDCSMSLLSNDPANLCLEACKNFVDKLPTRNARVTVIAFGYEGGEVFTYSSRFNIEYRLDADMVHVIVPFGTLDSTEEKDEYKATVTQAVMSNRENVWTFTPIGHALAAAVDLLEQNGIQNDKACIILVSDGVNEPRTLYQDTDLIEPASAIAGEHNWPIYCIELNYNNWNEEQVVAAQTLLDKICKNSGDREVGRLNCKTPQDVHVAFQKIFADFYRLPIPDPKPVKLPGEYEFTIPYLTSEATVDVFGDSIESVELIKLDTGANIKISRDMQTTEFAPAEELVAVVEENSYTAIKLICPEPGEWKVLVNGDADATVLVSDSALQEKDLKMVATASSSEAVLTKTDRVDVHAFFYYKDYEEHNNDFYTKNPAVLQITCSNGEVIEKEMVGQINGYSYSLSVADVPVGSFELKVKLKHDMFRTGVKVSNGVMFKTKNLPLEPIKTEPMELKAYVNGKVERIDLETIFKNPDGDPVTYGVKCTSDSGMTFEFNQDELVNDNLDLMAGVKPGTYELEISAKDPDMTVPLTYRFNLVVENRLPVQEADMTAPKLWLDDWSWQEIGDTEALLELNKHFSDPDGMSVTFTVAAADGEEGPIVEAKLDGDKLTVLPVNEGVATVTVTCSDGLSEIQGQFQVEVVSAKTVYWKENGFFWILGIVIFIVLVLICMTMFFTTKVRGKWAISVTVNHKTASCNPIALTTCSVKCKKRKFALYDLIQGAKKYLTTGDPTVAANITDYFTQENKADKIMLHGVALGTGFKISGVPKNNRQISVTHDGRPMYKGTIRSGNIQFTLRKTSNVGISEAIIVLKKGK